MARPALHKALKPRFAPAALSDIDEMLSYSLKQFGLAGAQRYAALMDSAINDLCVQAQRLGVRSYGTMSRTFFAYHLRFSNRKLASGLKVGKPRHLIFFRAQRDALMVARVLHDAMDFLQHLDQTS